ncbi:hypothetical protein KFL_015440010, partial [Klebsormidium nitens]
MAPVRQTVPLFAFLFAALLLVTAAPVSGGRLLLQGPSSTGPLPVSRIALSFADTLAQLDAKLAFVQSLRVAGGGVSDPNVRSFAAARVPIVGPSAPVGGFTVEVKVGTPPVSIPVIADIFATFSWVQGPDCSPCPGSTVCGTLGAQNAVFANGGHTSCPFTGALYYPSLSLTSVTAPDCQSVCPTLVAGTFNLGCSDDLNLPPTQCQYGASFGTLALAAGPAVLDTFSIGSVSTLGQKILLGTSILQPGSKMSGAEGVAGFSPNARSLPNQLKQVGAVPTATFAICLASGGSNGGSLFLGGVPTKPGGNTPYDFSFTDQPITPVEFVDDVWLAPPPADFLVNGVPAPGASAALAADKATAPDDIFWILDAGLDASLLPLAAYTTLLNQIRTFSGCPNVFTDALPTNGEVRNTNFIDLTTCSP